MAKGKVATPRGLVEVEWKRSDQGELQLIINVPEHTPVDVYLPNGQYVSLSQAFNQHLGCEI